MIHSTYNAFHLGDNLVHLNFLRRMALVYPDEQFEHYASPQHVPQLAPVVSDVPNIALPDRQPPMGAINAWRGANGYWYNNPQRNDFVAFHIEWFAYLAAKMGLDSPIRNADDMLFDYPALDRSRAEFTGRGSDFLIINSIPHSNQFRAFNPHAFESLIRGLMARGFSVMTTQPTNTDAATTNDGRTGLSVTDIGGLSCHCRNIVGIATGPIWTTFNVWTKELPRIVMLDSERLHLVPNVRHVRSAEEAEKLLLT